MKKKILKIVFILMFSIALFSLTGCEGEKVNEVKQNHSVVKNEVKKKGNTSVENKTESISESKIDNTVVKESSEKNEIIPSNTEEIAKNKVENNTTNVEEKAKSESEENTSVLEEVKEVPAVSKFNVGIHEFNFGTYETKESKMVDIRMEFATITINLKPDGTYSLKSDNQNISEDCSGTWIISGNSILLKKANEIIEYIAEGDNLFIGNGSYTLTYIE